MDIVGTAGLAALNTCSIKLKEKQPSIPPRLSSRAMSPITATSLFSKDIISSQVVEETPPLSESFTIIDRKENRSLSPDPHSTRNTRPSLVSHGTQTDDFPGFSSPFSMPTSPQLGTMSPWEHPVSPALSSPKGFIFADPFPDPFLDPFPDPKEVAPKPLSRRQSIRRQRKHSIARAEEQIAAAVIVYAAAEALSPPTSPPLCSRTMHHQSKRHSTVPEEVDNEFAISPPLISCQGPVVSSSLFQPSHTVDSRISGEQEIALRKSVTDLLAESKNSSNRDLNRDAEPPRDREHRHRRRSHRYSNEASKESSMHSSSRRHRRDSDPGSRRSNSETVESRAHSTRESVPDSPINSQRQDSGFSDRPTSSRRHARLRTPEEQAAHDRRKAERRLARERERDDRRRSEERERRSRDLRLDKGKGREVLSADISASPSRRRISRKETEGSASYKAELERTRDESPASIKKFLDIKNSESIMTTEIPPRDSSPRPSSLRGSIRSGKGTNLTSPLKDGYVDARNGIPTTPPAPPLREKSGRNHERPYDSSARAARQRRRSHTGETRPPIKENIGGIRRSNTNRSAREKMQNSFRRSLDGVRQKISRVSTDFTGDRREREHYEVRLAADKGYYSTAESSSGGDKEVRPSHHGTAGGNNDNEANSARRRRQQERRRVSERQKSHSRGTHRSQHSGVDKAAASPLTPPGTSSGGAVAASPGGEKPERSSRREAREREREREYAHARAGGERIIGLSSSGEDAKKKGIKGMFKRLFSS